METRKCCKCKKIKEVSEFYTRIDRESGIRSMCKQCLLIFNKSYAADSEYFKKRKKHPKVVDCRYNETYFKKKLNQIKARCNGKNESYHKKGIRNFLTLDDLKFLWKRDRASLLENPSIDRIDSKKNYTLINCRFIERWENSVREKRKPIIGTLKVFSKIYPSISEASRQTKINAANIWGNLSGKRKSAGGYLWKFQK